jgi:hypothetical protein
MERLMKRIQLFTIASILLCFAGCASAPHVAVQEPVGPCQRIVSADDAPGSLMVYSARRATDANLNAEAFLWNNDLGRNAFMYEPAHTDFTLYDADGKVVRHVRNADGRSAETPTSVWLPAGVYTVEAEAEKSAATTMTLIIPVVIEAGQRTTLHLEPPWERPAGALEMANVVRLPDGRVLGCRAQPMIGLNTR